MDNIYVNNNTACELVKVKKSTIDFLLSYSRSLDIVEAQGLKFENNLN